MPPAGLPDAEATLVDLAERMAAAVAADALLAAMARDKKVRGGRIALVLPRRIGEAFVTRDVPVEAIGGFLADAVTAA